MQIKDLVMVVDVNPTLGRPAQGRGGVGRRTDTDRRGYPPMSNVAGHTRAGKITSAPLKIFSSPQKEALQPVSSQKTFPSSQEEALPIVSTPKPTSPYPIIPLGNPDDDDFFLPSVPTGFSANPEAMTLALAPRKFGKKIWDSSSAARFAQRLVQYFSRPLHGTYEEVIFHADGHRETVVKPYNAPLPMLSEFATMNGLTERELKNVARDFPDMARALEFAKDVVKTHLVRGGLEGDYNPQVTVFAATNETDMKVKTEHTEKSLDMNDLLDRIEKANQPIGYGN